ncbi:EamA family transporter RarD [Marinospirillum alkaliphilum]|uniref:Chloramphenicol-sensitive protein RarD n=1 Tax=Marinospirillum alkaliphilum DSM 21637 TaxID=1122209 RepID=A0A1K1TN55_9GAMM|nr:EamA family transporter RarD [Marinospirillum alkaliphilum]SFX01733.1 chloramphenicol-sensitive protein RarD [Marinospirillum alkaliphilum DSM 21637]
MQGLWLAVAAYVIWGCFPLFFSLLNSVAAGEVLAHRVIWSLLATLLIILLMKRRQQLWQLLQQPRALGWLAVTSLLIGSNWLIFIWSVGQQRVMEASLGYFMTPLVSLVLARILLKEKLHIWQALAGWLAAAAVLWELYSLGSLPWIPLSLALTFGFYGLVRKQQPVDGMLGLTVETLWMLPVAMMWLGWMLWAGQNLQFGESMQLSLLLMASGVVTATPLLLFAAAAQRLDLSVVGFIMYINPTMQFISAVLILNEDYPPQRLITFALIWAAMLLFMWGLWQARRQLASAP